LLEKSTNIFGILAPDNQKYAPIISVFDTSGAKLNLISDILSQRLVCYREN